MHVIQECLGAGNGIGAGQAVLNFSAAQTCVGVEAQEAFIRDVDALFRDRCKGYNTVSESLFHSIADRCIRLMFDCGCKPGVNIISKITRFIKIAEQANHYLMEVVAI